MNNRRLGGIKAAFLPKFARYVAWPAAMRPEARAPFHLCVIGRDPFGRLLDQSAAGELIDGRAGPRRGMIHFTIVSGRVRFFIDEARAAERGISISSRLLALAAGVRQRR